MAALRAAIITAEKPLKVTLCGTFNGFSGFYISAKRCILGFALSKPNLFVVCLSGYYRLCIVNNFYNF